MSTHHATYPPERAESTSASQTPHDHAHHDMNSTNKLAFSATLHCLTGCAIGEVAGLIIGTAIGLSTGWTIALAVTLAFLFGYTLSTFPLVKSGLSVGAALGVVFAADTLSIATMEVVDNLVMAAIPGAMEAGLVNAIFWMSMMIALTAAFFAAYPVNRYLLQRGKGHALTHAHHGSDTQPTGARRFIPTLATPTLIAAIVAFMVGGLTVSVADQLGSEEPAPSPTHPPSSRWPEPPVSTARTTRSVPFASPKHRTGPAVDSMQPSGPPTHARAVQ